MRRSLARDRRRKLRRAVSGRSLDQSPLSRHVRRHFTLRLPRTRRTKGAVRRGARLQRRARSLLHGAWRRVRRTGHSADVYAQHEVNAFHHAGTRCCPAGLKYVGTASRATVPPRGTECGLPSAGKASAADAAAGRLADRLHALRRSIRRLALRHVLRQCGKGRAADARLWAGHRTADASFCLSRRSAAARLDKISAQARRCTCHVHGTENADRRSLAFARIIRYTSPESEGFLCL